MKTLIKTKPTFTLTRSLDVKEVPSELIEVDTDKFVQFYTGWVGGTETEALEFLNSLKA